MQEFSVLKKDEGQTSLKFLNRILPAAPNSFLFRMMRKKTIVLNDSKMDGHEKVKAGDCLKIYMTDDTISHFKEASAPIDTSEYEAAFKKFGKPEIVYEDEHVLLINKPSGVLSQKSYPNDLSANEWLIGYLLDEEEISKESLKEFKPSINNRLDRNTSGILCFSKTAFGATKMNALLSDRDVHKYYRTIVSPVMNEPIREKAFLFKDESKNKVMVSDKQIPGSSPIETGFKPVRVNNEYNLTDVEACLYTGKSHQIRAHLNKLGFYVLGDMKYGDNNINKAYRKSHGVKTHVLVAYKMVFPKMDDYEALSGKTIEISLPKIFNDLFNK